MLLRKSSSGSRTNFTGNEGSSNSSPGTGGNRGRSYKPTQTKNCQEKSSSPRTTYRLLGKLNAIQWAEGPLKRGGVVSLHPPVQRGKYRATKWPTGGGPAKKVRPKGVGKRFKIHAKDPDLYWDLVLGNGFAKNHRIRGDRYEPLQGPLSRWVKRGD